MELSPVVNRDLSRRVRAVTGAATAKQAIRDDIKLAARLIRVLDKRSTLYEKESKEETEAREKAEKEAAEVISSVYNIYVLSDFGQHFSTSVKLEHFLGTVQSQTWS